MKNQNFLTSHCSTLVNSQLYLVRERFRKIDPVTNRIPNSNAERHYSVVETDSNNNSNNNYTQT